MNLKKQAFNPYLPSWEYVPDGEPYVFGDRVYVFGSHDKYNGYVFCLGDYVCWSAPVEDMGNWRYEGVIYKKILIIPKNPRNTSKFAGFQIDFTTNLLLLTDCALICRNILRA